jgi:glycosyltransferase involved in cell wall biosynthesis
MEELKESHRIELTIVGDGPMRQCWQEQARTLGEAVRFLGEQNSAEVVRHIQQSHLLCLPSIRESGGAVLLEAMSCARPVLGIAHGGPAGIITEEVGRLVQPQSSRAVIDGLKDALKDVFVNPEEWRARGERGRAVAQQRHSWDAHLDEICEIYQEITAGAPVGAKR